MNFIPAVDSLVAIIIGIIILFEDYSLGKEVVDNLLGSADKETEEKIKEYCKNQKIELESIKTRKSGSATFAEVRIKLPKNFSIEEVEKITNKMRDELTNQIKNLKSIVIEVSSHEIEKGIIDQGFGRRFRWRGTIGEGIEYPEKEGYRIIIPFKDGKIYYDFGAPEYLVVDKNEKGEVIRKEVIKNPYFGLEERARAMRVVKAIMPNEIITKKIGEGAKQRLKEFGIKLTIVGEDFNINKI
jgi:predicted Fe-Mo cluster-binding NifX family protein